MRRLGSRFTLERKIGEGGMSVVYLGRDGVLGRPVAVKVLRGGFEDDSTISDRFRREGRTSARLSHPNIVQVYDAGEDELDGREVSFIVMEYVPGGDLKGLIDKKGPLLEKELARIGADVATGLTHAHERGVIHRDIKPQNVLMDEYGRSKLADFGIARALDSTQATPTGSYLGTASYSSPEQLRGEKVIPKSDVYSLGSTLYQAAIGEPPFSGDPLEVASQQLTDSPAPLRERGAALSEPFEDLILACLAKDPAERPDTANLQARLLRASAMASGTTATAASGETTTSNLVDAPWGAAAGLAGRAGAHRATEVGAEGSETVVQGMKELTGGSSEGQGRTLVAEQSLRVGRNRRTVLATGAAALILLAIIAGLYGLLNSKIGEESSQREVVVPSYESDSGETTTVPATSAPALPLEGAEQAVFDMYVEKSYRDVDGAWSYLSKRRQEEEGSKESWAQKEQIYTFTYVYFTQYPKAEASGEEARASFQAREVRTTGARLVTGTWACVVEGGAWKLDRLENEETQTL